MCHDARFQIFEESLSLVSKIKESLSRFAWYFDRKHGDPLRKHLLTIKSATTMLNTGACMGLLDALYLPRKQCSFLSYPVAD